MGFRLLTRGAGATVLFFSSALALPAGAQLEDPFDATVTADQAWLTNTDGATDIAWHADGRAVVTQKNGAITVRRPNGDQEEVTGTFDNVDTGSEKGLLGVVAHPDVATNDTFYFYVSDGTTSADKHRVYRGTLNDDDSITIDFDNPVIAASRMNGPGLEGPANHDGGGLFIYENHLYVGVGDTGANDEPPTNKYSSCLNKPNGKILRVTLDGSIPSDNPLMSETAVTSCTGTGADWGTAEPDRRVYAWGLRNPWRLWIDPHTDLLWIGDVGERQREEITVGRAGVHHGYPFFEGNLDFSMEDGALRLDKTCDQEFVPSRPCTAPVHDYQHSSGTSVTGGLIPEGCGWTNAFDGKLYYLFADYGANWMHALEVRPDRTGVVSSTSVDFAQFSGGPASIRQGPDGAVYVVFFGGGNVTRIAPTALSGPDCSGAGTGGTGGAGGGGAGGSGGASAGTGGSGNAGSGGAMPIKATDSEGGCGCRLATRTGQGLFAVALGAALALYVRARRRREKR